MAEMIGRASAFLKTWHGVIYAVSAFVAGILLSWHVLRLVTDLSALEIVVLVACLAGLAIGLWIRAGEARLWRFFSDLIIFAAGFALVLVMVNWFADNPATTPEWQTGLIFSGIFLIIYRVLITWFTPSAKLAGLPDSEREAWLAGRAADIRRKAELKALPSNGWYEIASFVTGAAMIGSFATTAIGFYHEIVDPLDPPLIQYGIPVGLSALAALIIWAGWNFVFLRIRLASNMFSRLFGFIAGFIVLVPMTFAIHTIFGIIGVGGTQGLRAHNLWYADVLDAYERRVDGIRAIEANRLEGALEYMQNQLTAAADSEETTGQGCGAGKGSLWTFYTDSASRTDTIHDIVTRRKNANQDIKAQIEQLRGRIRRPDGKLEDIQPDLAATADMIRKKIMETDNSSALPSVETFVTETRATVNSEAFFSGWSACTLSKKDVILAQINTLVDSVNQAATSAKADIEAKRSSPEFAIPVENRIETIPFIDTLFHGENAKRPEAIRSTENSNDVPVFVPLRPFWAVVSYAGSLMGYIALQLALDFSPAILGILFALLAPFPDRKTKAGRAWDAFLERQVRRFEKTSAPAASAPEPASVPPARQQGTTPSDRREPVMIAEAIADKPDRFAHHPEEERPDRP